MGVASQGHTHTGGVDDGRMEEHLVFPTELEVMYFLHCMRQPKTKHTNTEQTCDTLLPEN